MTIPIRCLFVLSLLAPLSPVCAEDRIVVKTLTDAGGKITLEKDGTVRAIYFPNSSAITPTLWQGMGEVTEVRQITLYNRCTLNDETLPLLKGLSHLEEFQVDGAHLTDQGMAAFADWTALRRITFFHVFWGERNFNGTGLKVFAGLPKLEAFGMGGSTLTDDGMEAVGTMTQLKELHIWHTLITDAGVKSLQKLKDLRSLKLAPQFNARITDAAPPHIAALEALEKLSLGETQLSYQGLIRLKSLPHLRELELDRVEIADSDLDRLKAELPDLRIKATRPNAQERESLLRAFAARAGSPR